jgi:hypothetical protein
MSNSLCNKVLALTSGLMALVSILSGCVQDSSNIISQTTQNNKSHWFVDSRGHFHTNDVKLAQKEMPFTIVVPTYIPDLFATNYQYEISGPFDNPIPNTVEVKIEYWDESHQTYISEYNSKTIMQPNEELKPVNYEIAGIQVLRQVTQFLTNSGTIEGLSFNWNTNGFTFEVKIFNIPENEGIKIVESMIKQIK